MPHSTAPDLLVLHALRCGGSSGAERVAEATGLATPTVETELRELTRTGLVDHLAGPFGGWGLTETGRQVVSERITAELDGTGGRAAVEAAYDRFLSLNPKLLETCTAWQMRVIGGTPTLNDHTDAGYDVEVLDRLADLHRRVEGVCVALAGSLARFERYPIRLSAALERAHAGAHDAIAESTSSYHTVWFQLHEDLLVTLGLPRS